MRVAQVTPLAQAHPKATTAARVKVSREFQKRQAAAAVLALLVKTLLQVASLAMAQQTMPHIQMAVVAAVLVQLVEMLLQIHRVLEVLEVQAA